jgi:hypothetical protein
MEFVMGEDLVKQMTKRIHKAAASCGDWESALPLMRRADMLDAIALDLLTDEVEQLKAAVEHLEAAVGVTVP